MSRVAIKFRSDSSGAWTLNNPTLAFGELGYETNTGKFKIGNGINAWNDSATKYFINDSDQAGLSGGGGGSSFSWGGARALVGGGLQGSSLQNVIDYFDITSTGNASDFGNLTSSRRNLAAVGDQTYGVFGGGFTTAEVNTIDYVTVATTGNAADFGDMTAATRDHSAVANGTRGVFAGGYTTTTSNVIEYITLGTTSGNATDFGDLTSARLAGCEGGVNDATRGVIPNAQTVNVIDYITFATTGNATDFGDHSGDSVSRQAAASDSTRGLIGGGEAGSKANQIHYITTQTTGNTTDFGDLTVARSQLSATSDETYCVFAGGRSDALNPDGTIDYVTIQTTGNASDFGDLNVARRLLAATSGNAS